MAYSSYGAFIYHNGLRRRDKEDVGVYDNDEAVFPSGLRIFANIVKNRERGTDEWWNHSQHGVMGDGPVRVACHKQGLPGSGIYFWPDGATAPQRHSPQEFTATPPLPIPAVSYSEDPAAWTAYHDSRWDYEYAPIEISHDFGTGLCQFTFTASGHSQSGHYEATMTEPDGTHWSCTYDYGYGAGLTDDNDIAQ